MSLTVQGLGYMCGKTYKRRTPRGDAVFVFSLGVYNPYKKRSEFFSAVAYGKTAEIVERNWKAKETVFITGELRYDEWLNKDKEVQRAVKVVVKAVDMVEWRLKKKFRTEAGLDRPTTPPPADDETADDDLPF